MTLLAFMMHALLPFFAVYALSSQADLLAEDFPFPDEKILICTSKGFKWLTLEELQNEKSQSEHGSQHKCPLCYVSAYGMKDFTNTNHTLFISFSSVSIFSHYLVEKISPKTRLLLLGRHTRAPPSLV